MKKGFDELEQVVGARLPIEINALSADQLKELAQLVTAALERHEAAFIAAEENVVNLAPRLLRGSVRRLLGAGGSGRRDE